MKELLSILKAFSLMTVNFIVVLIAYIILLLIYKTTKISIVKIFFDHMNK